MTKKKYERDYLKNFNKKYYLFLCADDKMIPVYHGSLRSILRFTSYRDFNHISNSNENSFKRNLIWNLNKTYDVLLPDLFFSKYTFKMGPNKNGNNCVDLVYSKDLDVLYAEAADIRNYVDELRIKRYDFDNPSEEKLEFARLICELIDKNYKIRLREPRESHVGTTQLDVLRTVAAKSPNYYELKGSDNFFTKFATFDSEVLLTALEYICKDVNKKRVLLDEISKRKAGYILRSNDRTSEYKVYKRRMSHMYIKLNQDGETSREIWQSIYNTLVDKKIIDLDEYGVKKIEQPIIKTEEVKKSYQDKKIDEYLKGKLEEKEIAKLKEDSYTDYLIQEGIFYNDAGEPLFDQEYDLDSAKRK